MTMIEWIYPYIVSILNFYILTDVHGVEYIAHIAYVYIYMYILIYVRAVYYDTTELDSVYI